MARVSGKVKVKPHRRLQGKKIVKVKGYSRKKRPVGRPIRKRSVGRMIVKHDKFGNLKGSEIIPEKAKSRKVSNLPALDIPDIPNDSKLEKEINKEIRQFIRRVNQKVKSAK